MITRLFFSSLFLLPLLASAQEMPAPLTAAERAEVVDSISAILDRSYVFPDIGKAIGERLHAKARQGDYDGISDPFQFAETLTEDVRSVNNDLHLSVRFSPQQIAEQRSAVSAEDSLAYLARQRRNMQMSNYGFREVKILDGNIGYLNLTGFYPVTEESGRTAEAAMNLLSNADALIIDLRENGGGDPAMIQLISSYLFDSEPVHLNTFYYRPQDDYSQTWTLPYVPGKRRPDIDLYVLTSKGTFSAAEEFSYNLRNLERATLVGEVTGGGAHPGGTQIATDRYTVWVPTGRAINPITDTNWEGTGVQPHVDVPADQALDVARIKAFKKLVATSEGPAKYRYEWALAGLEAEQNPVSVDQKILQSYAGQYGPRMLSYEDGHLYYQREGRGKHRLVPMSDELFLIEEIPYFRIKVNKEGGKITGLTGMYDNGHTDFSQREDAGKGKPRP